MGNRRGAQGQAVFDEKRTLIKSHEYPMKGEKAFDTAMGFGQGYA